MKAFVLKFGMLFTVGAESFLAGTTICRVELQGIDELSSIRSSPQPAYFS